jgi:hypothetical protein
MPALRFAAALIERRGGRAAGTNLGPLLLDVHDQGDRVMLKFLGTTAGIIFLIGLLVVIGLFALIF